MISVLCPSRERAEQLGTSVDSLVMFAADDDGSQIEIIVVADDDDQATISVVTQVLPARLIITTRKGYAGLHEYYELAAAAARGDWLMVWNDDAVMTTPAWNKIIEALPPEVLIADIASTQSPLCCFPAVRSDAVKALGRFATPNPHVDTCWQDIGRATNTIATVPVFARHDSEIKPNATHGYYEDEHRAQLADAIERIRHLAVTGAA